MTALSAFSAACWAWKQQTQGSMSGPCSRTTRATVRSVLALECHRRTSARRRSGADIDRSPFAKNRAKDRPDEIGAPGDVLGVDNDHVRPKWYAGQRPVDLRFRMAPMRVPRDDDQQVSIAVEAGVTP